MKTLQQLAEAIVIELVHYTDTLGVEDIQAYMSINHWSYDELRKLVISEAEKYGGFDEADIDHWVHHETVTDTKWVKTEQVDYTELQTGESFIGYNPNWVDADWNPKGVRECYPDEGSETFWTSMKWNGDYDCYDATTEVPTHIRAYPEPPL
jgi:hypothetical protein